MKKLLLGAIAAFVSFAAIAANNPIGGSSSSSSIDTNNPIAFKSSVSTPILYVGSLAYSISNQTSSGMVVIGMTNAAVYMVKLTNGTSIRWTNYTHGAVGTLVINGGGSARSITNLWPANVCALWRNGTNTTSTNTTFVSWMCDTNLFGSNVVHLRIDVQ